MSLLDEVLAAHGGAERWAAARTIRGRVPRGGLLLRTRVPGNRRRRLPGDRRAARAALRRSTRIPRRGQRGGLRPRRGADRDRRRRGARVARAIRARAVLRPPRGCGATCAGTPSTRLLRGLRDVELPDHAAAAHPRRGARCTRASRGSEDGETWRRLEVALPRRASTPTRASRPSTSTPTAAAPPRLRRRGRRRLGARRAHVRRPRRGRWPDLPDQALGAADRPAQPGDAGPDDGLAAALRDRGRMSDTKPVLWHIPVSHYSEKVRWALDHKGIEHERRAPPPGAHMAVALWLTRGARQDLPGAAARRRQHRRLDRDHRGARAAPARAAALSGRPGAAPPGARARGLLRRAARPADPPARLARAATRSASAMAEVARRWPPAPAARPAGSPTPSPARFGAGFVQLRYRVGSDEAAAAARAAVVAALDRLDAELDAAGGEYLVGDRVLGRRPDRGVALLPAGHPARGPAGAARRPARRLLELPRAALGAARATAGSSEMFRRHRQPASYARRARPPG